MVKIGKTRLWPDGVTVSVHLKVPARAAVGLSEKMTLIVQLRQSVDTGWLTETDRDHVWRVAELTRADPEQQARAQEAKRNSDAARQVSAKKLMGRIFLQKQEAFKKQVRDLLARGATMEQIVALAENAVVEGVHND